MRPPRDTERMTEPIGARVKKWRIRRGWTQEDLARLADLSQVYISQVETGVRVPDRRSTLNSLCLALDVTLSQLLGQPSDDVGDPKRSMASSQVPLIRSALIKVTAGGRLTPTRGLDQLAAAVADARRMRMASSYAALANVLPGLILDTAAHGPAASPLAVETLYCARATLKVVGWHDLAREAATHGRAVALEHGDPAWIGQAVYSYVMTIPADLSSDAYDIAAQAMSDLESAGGRAAQETYGFLHLICALQAAIGLRGDVAHEHLLEAAALARRLGEPGEIDGPAAGFNGQWFGPTNVTLWSVAIAAELGDTGAALQVRDHLDLRQIPSPNRKGYYWVDVARALAAEEMTLEALVALANAERAAPEHVRMTPLAVDLARSLVAQAEPGSGAALDLAHRLDLHAL